MTSSTAERPGVFAAVGAWTRRRVDALVEAGGPAFGRLVVVNSASTAGDTLVAVALAGTLFFSVPSAEARANVALYLGLTLAPFVVLAPGLTLLLNRFPVAYRHGLVVSSALRAVAALAMARGLTTLWLYPLAFALLVLSRLFAISRASILPVTLSGPTSLVSANARLAQLGVAAGAVSVPLGAAGARFVGDWLGLILAALAFTVAALAAHALPPPPPAPPASGRRLGDLLRTLSLPRSVRFAQLATAGVRLLNGFLLLLLAFALRSVRAGLMDFGALLAAAGAGYVLAATLAPWLERRLREEPMVVVALAVEAGAAFVAAQYFGVPAAAALAGAAGLAWGTAKFAFDGLLQATLPPSHRGLAFTRSETLFAIAWVVGALIPVGLPLPVRLGLSVAGLAALSAQVVYVAALLVPEGPPPPRSTTTDDAGPEARMRRSVADR